MVNYELIGKRIKEIRQQQGLTQMQLAEETGLSLSYIGRIERADKKPSLKTTIGIADSLGVTVDELLCGSQRCDPYEYQTDMDSLMSDCASGEKRVIYEVVKKLKESLRENVNVADCSRRNDGDSWLWRNSS